MKLKNIIITTVTCIWTFNGNPILGSATLLDGLYHNLSGFNIPAEEHDEISAAGGAPTYGEITYESMDKLLQKLNLTKKDVFYDLGCGNGKVVIQTYLTTPAKKCIGIELSKTRCNQAKKVGAMLKNKSLLKKNQKLIFKAQDIQKTNLNDATVVFMCSTCFSEELMKNLMNKLAKLKKGARVATLQSFPTNNYFTLKETLKLPMTWSQGSPVYLYELTKIKR